MSNAIRRFFQAAIKERDNLIELASVDQFNHGLESNVQRHLRESCDNGFPNFVRWHREARAEATSKLEIDRVDALLVAMENFVEAVQSGGADPELPLNAAITALAYVADSSGQADKPADSKPPPQDGPVGPDGFRHGGKIERGLEPKPFRMLSFLWDKPDRVSDLSDLAEVVLEDSEAIYEKEPHGWAKRLNGFFRKHGIPFHATIKNKQAAIVEGSPNPARKPAKVAKRKKPTNRP